MAASEEEVADTMAPATGSRPGHSDDARESYFHGEAVAQEAQDAGMDLTTGHRRIRELEEQLDLTTAQRRIREL